MTSAASQPGGEPPHGAEGKVLPGALAALATGLCHDGNVLLELGSGWSWDPSRRVLTVDKKDLRHRGADYCAGIVAHEVGHVLISRYLSFPVDFPSQRAAYAALNGIEDPRVEAWIVGRFPGAKVWLEAGRGESHLGGRTLPSFMAFCLASALEGEQGFAPVVGLLPTGVRDALDRTRAARRRFAETTPPTDLRTRDAREVTARYARDVQPHLSGPPWPPPLREQAVRVSAWDAHELATREILPAARALYLADQERIARYLERNPAAAAQARRHVRDVGGPWDQLGAALNGPGAERAGEDARDLAGALLDQAVSGRAHRPLTAGAQPGTRRSRRRPGEPAPTSGRRPLRPPRSSAPYDVAYRQVARQVDQLVRQLDAVLRPRKRLGQRSGYPSGQRLDLRRVMTYEADPRQWNRLWTRATIPDRREVAIGLLVDLSGSMCGEPARHALLGTVLLAETLHRLQVPFAIDGFQDVLIPLHDFEDPLDASVRARIAEMPLEVTGARQGGHNNPGHNDDGPCLREFAAKVLDRAAHDRVIIVLSDGEPAGRRSQPSDLTAAVRHVSAPDQGVRLIGLGLGPGTEHVRSYYPECVANVPLAQLATQIGGLLERVLVGPTP